MFEMAPLGPEIFFVLGGLAVLLAVGVIMIVANGWPLLTDIWQRLLATTTAAVVLFGINAFVDLSLVMRNGGELLWFESGNDFSIAFMVGFFLLLALVEGVLGLIVVRRKPYVLTANAVKVGVDSLPDGICFISSTGEVLLVNREMSKLSELILGHPMLNGFDLRDALRNESLAEGVIVSREPLFCVRDTEGQVWRFEHRELTGDLEGVVEVMAVNITEAFEIGWELDKKELRLAGLENAAAQNRAEMDDVARSLKDLQLKLQPSADLDAALVATEKFLADPKGKPGNLLNTWEKVES